MLEPPPPPPSPPPHATAPAHVGSGLAKAIQAGGLLAGLHSAKQ